MDSEEIYNLRKKLGKTQKELARLLGISLKAVHSYEQGWRNVPVHVERQIYFLLSRLKGDQNSKEACWDITMCPEERKSSCPAWEFQAGDVCWFINGTICKGEPRKNWGEKIVICKSCDVFAGILD